MRNQICRARPGVPSAATPLIRVHGMVRPSKPQRRHHETFEPPLVPCRFCRLGGGAGIWRAAPSAPAPAPDARAASGSRGRRRGRRRRRALRPRGGSPPARQALRPVRGGGASRRTLHHRYQHLRRALRSRRPLDLCRRHQSAGAARDPDRARYLSGAARPAHAHRPALRARRRDGGFSRHPGARQYRHRDAAARKGDVACAQALPKDLRRMAPDGRVRAGTLRLRQGSSRRSPPPTSPARASATTTHSAAQGFGTLLAKLCGRTAVSARDAGDGDRCWSRTRLEVQTTKGDFQARAAIVTASTNRSAAGKIKFAARSAQAPSRRRRQAQARQLRSRGAGTDGQSARAEADELAVREEPRASRPLRSSPTFRRSTLCMIDVAGTFGRDLSAKGEAAMIDFAITWLSGLYGTRYEERWPSAATPTRWNERAVGARRGFGRPRPAPSPRARS